MARKQTRNRVYLHISVSRSNRGIKTKLTSNTLGTPLGPSLSKRISTRPASRHPKTFHESRATCPAALTCLSVESSDRTMQDNGVSSLAHLLVRLAKSRSPFPLPSLPSPSPPCLGFCFHSCSVMPTRRLAFPEPRILTVNSRPDKNGSTRISWPGNLAASARTPGSRSFGARILLVWSIPLDDPSVVGFRKRGYEGRDDDERSGRVTLAPISFVETTRNGAVGIPWWRRMIYHY